MDLQTALNEIRFGLMLSWDEGYSSREEITQATDALVLLLREAGYTFIRNDLHIELREPLTGFSK